MVAVIIYGVGFQFAWGTIPWIYPAASWLSCPASAQPSPKTVFSRGIQVQDGTSVQCPWKSGNRSRPASSCSTLLQVSPRMRDMCLFTVDIFRMFPFLFETRKSSPWQRRYLGRNAAQVPHTAFDWYMIYMIPGLFDYPTIFVVSMVMIPVQNGFVNRQPRANWDWEMVKYHVKRFA